MKDDQNRRSPRLEEMGLEGYAPYLMNRIIGRYNANLRSDIAALGLTTAKMRALACLAVRDGLPIGELGVLAVVEQSTLSRALDGLQRDGLITRTTDADDQRSSRVHMTSDGQATFDRLWLQMVAGHDQMFADIDAEERQAFIRTLHKMLTNIRVHDV